MMIACLLVPTLALTTELVSRPHLFGHPVALADEKGLRVFQATPEAAQRGVHPGLTLAEAVSLCPRLAVLQQRPARITRAAEQLIQSVAAISPLVEPIEPGLILADLVGLDGIYPNPADLERALLNAAPPAFGARLGIAGQRFTAIVAAHAAPPALRLGAGGASENTYDEVAPLGTLATAGSLVPLNPTTPSDPRDPVASSERNARDGGASFKASNARFSPSGPRDGGASPSNSHPAAPTGPRAGGASENMRDEVAPFGNLVAGTFSETNTAVLRVPSSGSTAISAAAHFLANRPAALLPLPEAALWQLRLYGIETIGQYAQLPRHAAAAQFGAPGDLAWLAAHALDTTPVRPIPFETERVIERSQSEPPLVSRESMAIHARQLLQRALRHPRAATRFVRQLRLRAITEDDQLWERTQTLREPTGDRDRLWLVIQTMIEYAEFPGLISELELELSGLTVEQARQPGLFRDHAHRREQLDQMIRQLKTRFGRTPITQIVEVEPWNRLPERRHALMDYDP